MLYTDNTAKLLGLEEVNVKKFGTRKISAMLMWKCLGVSISAPAAAAKQIEYTITALKKYEMCPDMAALLTSIFANADMCAIHAASVFTKRTASFLAITA